MKPSFWILEIDGIAQEKRYFQRATANGAAIILRAQGHAVNVKGQCGFEPLFVAVYSYLPGIRIDDDDEATELATDYLAERQWFSEPRAPDYII